MAVSAAVFEERCAAGAECTLPRPKFTNCLPPPNATGVLHMGHATHGTVLDERAERESNRVCVHGHGAVVVVGGLVVDDDLVVAGEGDEDGVPGGGEGGGGG